jgi:hypothetical protein
MTDLNCKDVTGMLKGDFGALWHCTQRGKSLEIITPYIYPDSSFVSVFITKRGNRFIVSDGAQVSEFFQSAKGDEPFFASLIARSRVTHGVSEFQQGGRTFFYKETKDHKLISSIAFDVVNFLVGASNAAYLATAEEDSQDKNSFRMRADTFIKHQITKRSGKTVSFNKKMPEVKEATFSAVVTGAGSKLWLVIYLTGSNLKYFQLSVSNAIVNVEFLKQSTIYKGNHVRSVIPFINDEAIGYQPSQLTQRLGRLSDLTGNHSIPWKRKEEIIQALA